MIDSKCSECSETSLQPMEITFSFNFTSFIFTCPNVPSGYYTVESKTKTEVEQDGLRKGSHPGRGTPFAPILKFVLVHTCLLPVLFLFSSVWLKASSLLSYKFPASRYLQNGN